MIVRALQRRCAFFRTAQPSSSALRKAYRTTGILAMSNKAAFVEAEKGRIVVRDAEIGQPGEGEVLVKVLPFLNLYLKYILTGY
jgi:hypothetical protein